MDRLRKIDWRGALQLALALALAVNVGGATIGTAFAQDGTPGGPDDQIVGVAYNIAERVMKILVMISVAVFGPSMVLGALSAQTANLVGSPVAVSQSWMKIITGIVTFVAVVVSPMLVGMIFDMVRNLGPSTIDLPSW